MPDVSDVLACIKRYYGVEDIIIDLLNNVPEKFVYQVTLSTGTSWILRMYQVVNDQSIVLSPSSQARVLAFLEEQHYPTIKIIRSIDGEIVIIHDGWHYLMTTFMAGTSPDWSATSFYNLGATLGKLHALQLDSTLALPRAGMLPGRELVYARKQLKRVESLVPAYLQPRYEELLQAIASMDRLEDLPLVCIHNDCHPANSIYTSDGQILLIDWEGAGLGSPLIDVGFLLASSDGKFPWTPLMPSDTYHLHQERIAAIVEGYRQHHTLTLAELERLPDAIRFRSLVYGACNFAATIAERGQEDAQWWWLRYTAAEKIAASAKRCFLG